MCTSRVGPNFVGESELHFRKTSSFSFSKFVLNEEVGLKSKRLFQLRQFSMIIMVSLLLLLLLLLLLVLLLLMSSRTRSDMNMF